jgi:hypothetical protein
MRPSVAGFERPLTGGRRHRATALLLQ